MTINPSAATLDPGDGGTVIDLMAAGLHMLDVGWPEPRRDARSRALASGEVDRTVWHGPRAVTAQFRSRDNAVARRLFASAMPHRRPVLTYTLDGITRRMRLSGDVAQAPWDRQSPSVLPGVVAWRCPDGIAESASLHSAVAAIGPAATDGGLTWPLTWPLDYGFASGPATLDAVNMGDLPAWPVLRVDGPVDGITVSNDTTGQHLTVGYDLPAGQYFEVVMRDRAVYLNGLPSASLLEWLQTPADWWQLWPGRSTIRLSALTSAQPAKVTAAWRDAYSW